MKKAYKIIISSLRFVFVLLLLLSAFVFAMFQGGQVSWTIFYMILPFGLYSILLFLYPLSDLAVQRIIQTPSMKKGEKLVVESKLKRNYRFPLLYTVVSDKWREKKRCFLRTELEKSFRF